MGADRARPEFRIPRGGADLPFHSARYVLFLAAAACVHALLPPRRRNLFLLAASWGFYALCSLRFLPLLLLSVLVNYALALGMERRPSKKGLYLALGLCADLGALFLCKYLGFFAQLAAALTGWPGGGLPALALPAGISFYTFVVSGYLIDVFRGDRPPERRFCEFALFASFFPAVLSGPIARAEGLLPQLHEPDRLSGADAKTGVTRFLIGLSKKLLLADQLAIFVNTAYAAPAAHTGMQLLAAALAYSLQIYCDFSAYSDMAVGSALLFGIRLPENFDAPYLARSIRDFWRRWHISLSSWFRDYLYIPLGGSRRGRLRAWFNVLVVFAVSGLWHGAALTFLVWGLLNGVYQVLEGLLRRPAARLRGRLGLREDAAPLRWAQTALTFLLLTVTWVFFRAESLSQALLILRRIATLAGGVFPLGFAALGLTRIRLAAVGLCALALFVCEATGWGRALPARLCGRVWPRYAVWALLVLAVAVFGAYGSGYRAQEFVYFRF
jgi:alginate O-acetyltransferase complex protein AlgI